MTRTTLNPVNRSLLKVIALTAVIVLAAASVPDNLMRVNTTAAATTLPGSARTA